MKARVVKEKVTVYCRCGAAFTSWGPPKVATPIRTDWLRLHGGPGHGPATKEQARSARGRP